MRGLKAFYVGSVALLVLLALATLGSPLILPSLRREPAPLAEAGKVQVLARSGEWILQYNLVNQTTSSGAYTFEISAPPPAAPAAARAPSTAPDRGSVLHTSSVHVDGGRPYVFIYHLRPEQVPHGSVQFTVHRGGDAAPLEDLTLHLGPATSKAAAR